MSLPKSVPVSGAAAAPDAANTRLVLPHSIEFGSSLPNGAAKIAVDVLGRRIANDIYEPGDIMPTEPELALSLGVSRATVRDAVKVLSGKGLVRTARRYGTRVRPVEEWNLLDADVAAWHEPSHPRLQMMFRETTEMRTIFEPAAAALAAERATPAQVEAMLAAAYAMHPDEDDAAALFLADCRFHATLLEATGNQMMQQLRSIVLTMLRISYEFGVNSRDSEPVTREGHIEVAEAIRDHDAETARSAMARMLERNRRTAMHPIVARRTGPAADGLSAAPPAGE
jgi:DNA-binding FadR family transcriptional regulator